MTPETIEQNLKLPTPEMPATENMDEQVSEQEMPLESSPEQSPMDERAVPIRQPAPFQAVAPTPRQMDELMARVEKILEDDLGEAYNKLSPIAKQEFKVKGEQTATKIRQLMKDSTLKVKKIFKLILDWLKLLPGINRFFLEQEAKIKTDRLIELHKNR